MNSSRAVVRWLGGALVAGFVLIGSGVAAAAPTAAVPKVVVAAVPDLRWEDVVSGAMPAAAALARAGAAGVLSVKAADRVTRCVDGVLTLAAGNRAAADTKGCAPAADSWAALRERNLRGVQRARLGALGDALRAAGVRTAAVGANAGWLLADRDGRVDDLAPDLATGLAVADVVAVENPALYAAGVDRRAARAHVDRWVADVARRTPKDALLLVVGVSDGRTGRSRLHVVVARGPGFGPGALTSASTGRVPYAQLIDIAPTILSARRLATPSWMSGAAMRVTGHVAPAAGSLADADRHAVAAGRLAFGVGLVICDIALLFAALVVSRLPEPAAARGRLRVAALVLAGVPVAGYLANGVPWWRLGWPAYVVLTVVLAAAVAAIASAGRHRAGPVELVAGTTLVVLVVDQLAGAPLQLAAPLGDSPLVAGRFHGVGNACFALLAVASILLAAHVGRRRAGMLAAAAIGAGAIAVDGLPSLGDDLGGVLALGPAVAVLLLLISSARVSLRRAVVALSATFGVALAFAAGDYFGRPATHRTHMGRFVGQLLHGGAGGVVRRKLDASLGSVSHSAFTLLVLAAIAYLVIERRAVLETVRACPSLGAALPAVAVVAVLGAVLNDSGIVIPGMAAALLLPLLVALAPTGRAGAHSSSGALTESEPT